MSVTDVDEFVASLPSDWRYGVAKAVLADIRAAATFDEAIKWRNPYFALSGAAVLKWYVGASAFTVYFYRGCELADPRNLFTDQETARMRKVRLEQEGELPRPAFRDLVAAAVALEVGAS